MNKRTILTEALEGRDNEVFTYQINIDNYELAIAHISKMPPEERAELSEFSKQLRDLLASEQLEQKKAKVIQAVIKQQLESMNVLHPNVP